jgi:hypothetical protein
MGLFSRRGRGRDEFDLASLRLPRLEVKPEIGVVADRTTVRMLTTCDGDIAPTMAPMSPFVLAVQDEPTILVKLAGLSAAEAAELSRAVRAGGCLAVAAYRSYPTFPMFVLALFVYDSLEDPMRFEGYRDITTADVQDFLVALDRTGGRGQVRLYGESAELLATGPFALRLPPFGRVTFPYRTTGRDLHGLWQACKAAAAWLHQIPESRRNFAAAVNEHVSKEPPL